MSDGSDTAGRLARNSIWLFSAEALSKIIALATQIFAARYLGQAGYGIFSFAFAATGAFIVFIDTGIGTYLTREISRSLNRAQELLGNVFFLKWRFSFIIILLLSAALYFSSLEMETIFVSAAIGTALMVQGYTEMYLSVFRSFEKMAIVSIFLVSYRVLFFIFGISAILLGGDVVVFSTVFLMVSIAVLICARWKMTETFNFGSGSMDWNAGKKIFRDCLPICGVILFTYIYFRIDVVLIFFLMGESEAGWYSAAFKLIESLSLLMASVRWALFPIFSRTFDEKKELGERIWKEAARYLLMIAIPMAAGLVLLAPRLTDLLFGFQYREAVPVLKIMALGFPLLCLTDLASYLLLSANRTEYVLRVALSAAIFNVVLNFFLIPHWGIYGAAVVAVLSQCLVLSGYAFKIREIYGRLGMIDFIWRPLLAATGMGLMITTLFSLQLGLLVFAAVLSYFFLLFILRGFNEFDLLVLKKILKSDQEKIEG